MRKICTFIVAALLIAMGATAQNNIGKTPQFGKAQLEKPQFAKSQPEKPIKERIEKKQQTETFLGGTPYYALSYSTPIPTDGTQVSGSLTPAANTVELWDWEAVARGYSFQATAGKTYKITATFTTTEYFNSYADVWLLDEYYDELKDIYTEGYGDKELTVSGSYTATANKTIKVLISSDDLVPFSYKIKIEEINKTAYTALNYSTPIPTNGTQVSGSLTPAANMVDIDGWDAVACGYSFQAVAGKTYKITATYTTAERFYSYVGIYVLNALTGNEEDDMLDVFYTEGSGDRELTFNGYYTATTNKTVKLLIFNYDDFVPFGYKITIEEANIPSYISLDYSTRLSTNNTPVSGSLSKADSELITPYYSYFGNNATGKGYTFAAQTQKTYTITCTFKATKDTYSEFGLYLLTGDALQGGYADVIDYDYKYLSTTEQKITLTYVPEKDGDLRILLCNYGSGDANYSIQVKEKTVLSYTTIDYPALVVGGTNVNGTLTMDNNLMFNPEGDFYYYPYITGKGYSFNATAGKQYRITCNFFGDFYSTGFYVLNGGTLTGIFDDDLINKASSWWSREVTYTFTATNSGNVRILLFNNDDYYYNDLLYSISVKEASTVTGGAITVKQLLDNTTNAITYSNNLAFTASGNADKVVNDPFFGSRNYYAAAYKITLAAGNNIQIHSVKEGDSYLCLFKSNGSGGYDLVDSNDDYYGYYNGDSYINYTADYAEEYYIVITDYYSETPGQYYIAVWNTAAEPGTVISAISASAGSITVCDKVGEIGVRLALMSLNLTGTTSGNPVEIMNNPSAWTIATGGKTATYYPGSYDAPMGYTFAYGLQKPTVTINYVSHSWGEWQVTRAATCSANGSKQRVCSGCGEIETEAIPKLTGAACETAIETVTAEYNVYPNPTIDKVYLPTEAQVKLYSAHGALLYSGYTNTVDLSGYKKGVYLLQINNETVVKIMKL